MSVVQVSRGRSAPFREAAQTRDRSDPREAGPAARSRWLSFGLAAVLGLAAGTMLFAGEAHGRDGARRRG